MPIKKENLTALVKHKPSVKARVEKAIAGTTQSIGGFYDEAAEEKLKSSKAKFSFRPTPKNIKT
jgi:hypothetical protein